MAERLNKYLALHTGISRREADDLIRAGKVDLNDSVATLGDRVEHDDVVSLNGKVITDATDFIYIALHKPTGYVCSRKRQGDAPTVYELLPPELHHLKLVGRLDQDSSGIILLTNDGDFSHQMTHPSFRKVKIYEVALDHDLQPLHQQMISDFGVALEDGTSKFALERLSEDERKSWRITMHEGRNRQIRRTFAALGYTVTSLHRTQFGNYSLGDMTQTAHKSINIS